MAKSKGCHEAAPKFTGRPARSHRGRGTGRGLPTDEDCYNSCVGHGIFYGALFEKICSFPDFGVKFGGVIIYPMGMQFLNGPGSQLIVSGCPIG